MSGIASVNVKALATNIQERIHQTQAVPDLPTVTKQLVKEIIRLKAAKKTGPSWQVADRVRLEKLEDLYDKALESMALERRLSKA